MCLLEQVPINAPSVLILCSTCAVGDLACSQFIDDGLVPDFSHCISACFNNLKKLTLMASSLSGMTATKALLHISPKCTLSRHDWQAVL